MCDGCEVVNINGCNCHEYGCPDAWKDYTRYCKWCGYEFTPVDKCQLFCDETCTEVYYS